MNSRHFYRQRAIARRRDPDQDAKNLAASEAMRQRVTSRLADVLPVELLAAAVEQLVAGRSNAGTG